MAIVNIAPSGYAFQSSISPWSRSENEANNALDGKDYDDYAFHTWNESNAWWIVDLKKIYPIDSVRIFLRKKYERRNYNVKFFISTDLASWQDLGHGVVVKSDIIEKTFKNRLARFIKIEVENNYLHLRKVEIFSDNELLYFRGYLLYDDAQIARSVIGSLMRQSYERQEIDLALAHLGFGDNILELGASLGAISTCILKESKVAKYYAVEANPDLIPLINKNHALNNVKCYVVNAAIGKRDGEADFYFHRESWKSSLFPFKDPVKVEKVKLIALSNLLKQTESNFLICDIEGGEFNIFNEEVNLDNVDKLLIELHPIPGHSVATIFDYFLGKGFNCQQKRPSEERQYVFFFNR